jgi:hypothetical protein
MRPSTPAPLALIATLLVAVLVVAFFDISAISAAADPLPTGTGAVFTPISPSTISRTYSHSSLRISSRLLDGSDRRRPCRRPATGGR